MIAAVAEMIRGLPWQIQTLVYVLGVFIGASVSILLRAAYEQFKLKRKD